MELGKVIRHTEQELNVSEMALHRRSMCVSPNQSVREWIMPIPATLGRLSPRQELTNALAVLEKTGLQYSKE